MGAGDEMDIDTRLYKALASGAKASVLNIRFNVGSVDFMYCLAWPSSALSNLASVGSRAELMQVVEDRLPDWVCAVSEVPIDVAGGPSSVYHSSILLMPKHAKGYEPRQKLFESLTHSTDGQPHGVILKETLDSYFRCASAKGPKDDTNLIGTSNSRFIRSYGDQRVDSMESWATMVLNVEVQAERIAVDSVALDAVVKIKLGGMRV